MKISIITATYNSSATLRDTMESVLSQSYTDFEHIIVDGLSKDNTLDIIHEFEPRYKGRLKVVSEKDKGLYDAMNKGISMATGEVVGLLNSDDFYTDTTILSSIADIILLSNTDAVYGDVHYVHSTNLKKCVRYYSSRLFRRPLMRFGFMPAHPSFYCRREIYEKYGMFNTHYKIAADFENLLRLIFIHRIKTVYLPKDFVTMRIGGVSSSGFQSHKQIMQDHLKALHDNGVYSNILLLSSRYVYKMYERYFGRQRNYSNI